MEQFHTVVSSNLQYKDFKFHRNANPLKKAFLLGLWRISISLQSVVDLGLDSNLIIQKLSNEGLLLLSELASRELHVESDIQESFDVIVLETRHPFVLLPYPSPRPCHLISANVHFMTV